MISTWARAAISGTTPPKAACAAIWLITSSERISPEPSGRRRTTAAAVSSQVVSIPSTRIRLISGPGAFPALEFEKAHSLKGTTMEPVSVLGAVAATLLA